MKIKWKIVSASVGIIVLLTLSIVFFTHEEVNSLVFSESSEELQNYSNMGLQLFERSYEGSWSIKEGKLFKVKPKGTDAERKAIIANFESQYLNNWYKIEYEVFSKDGIPLKPVGIGLRDCDSNGQPKE